MLTSTQYVTLITSRASCDAKYAGKQTSFKIQFYIGFKVTSFDFHQFYFFGPNSPSPNAPAPRTVSLWKDIARMQNCHSVRVGHVHQKFLCFALKVVLQLFWPVLSSGNVGLILTVDMAIQNCTATPQMISKHQYFIGSLSVFQMLPQLKTQSGQF